MGGRRSVTEAIRAGLARRVLVARGARETAGLRELLLEAERWSLAPERVEAAALDALGVGDHQGVAAFLRALPELGERDLRTFAFPSDALVVAFDGITDPQNFGACARSAEAAGTALLLTRERRAAPLSMGAIRASAGALLHLPVVRVANVARALAHLRDRGFSVVGLDQEAMTTIHEVAAPGWPLAVVVGAEDVGLSRLVREECDLLVSIPMRGRTASLNASAALAAALFGFALRPRG